MNRIFDHLWNRASTYNQRTAVLMLIAGWRGGLPAAASILTLMMEHSSS